MEPGRQEALVLGDAQRCALPAQNRSGGAVVNDGGFPQVAEERDDDVTCLQVDRPREISSCLQGPRLLARDLGDAEELCALAGVDGLGGYPPLQDIRYIPEARMRGDRSALQVLGELG